MSKKLKLSSQYNVNVHKLSLPFSLHLQPAHARTYIKNVLEVSNLSTMSDIRSRNSFIAGLTLNDIDICIEITAIS